MATISEYDTAQLSMTTMSYHHRYEHGSKAGGDLPQNAMGCCDENTRGIEFPNRDCRGCVGATKQSGHKAQMSFAGVARQCRALKKEHPVRADLVKPRQTGAPASSADGGTQRRWAEAES